MMSNWAAEYAKAKRGRVNYQPIVSGGGIQQRNATIFDFGCTDGPMNDEHLTHVQEAGGVLVHIPLVMAAVVPAYNLAEVNDPLPFTGPLLAVLDTIRQWNDPAITALNPNVLLPHKGRMAAHRSGQRRHCLHLGGLPHSELTRFPCP
jgi:ABC-type phosphate transport system substrate-binding protein